MRVGLWAAFFVVSNVIGVEVFKAAMTLPLQEALVPGVLTVPLVALSAVGVTQLVAAWKSRDE